MHFNMEVEELSTPRRFTTTPRNCSCKPYCAFMEEDDDDKVELLTFQLSPKPFDGRRTFLEELDFHKRNPVWGFRYGEEAARGTKEHVVACQRQFLANHSIQPHHSTANHDNALTNVPLPFVSWGCNKEIWEIMLKKDEVAASRRYICGLFGHPRKSVLRAVLLDWLMEVCQSWRLKRVTFYLAVDYIDRYLTVKPTVAKSYMQLLGITSLFIASKMEEFYPLKVKDLSSLCDGACNVNDILNCEKVLLNTLGWEVNLMTPPEWLNVFMQIHQGAEYIGHEIANYWFMFPQYSGHNFINAMNLIDLMVLDPGFFYFKYSVIAASALYLYLGASIALRVTGFKLEDVKYCVDYMNAYYATIKNSGDPQHNLLTPCSSCNYCKSVVEASKLLHSNHIQLIMSETFSLQTYVNTLHHFETGILVRLAHMGFHIIIETSPAEDVTKYTRPYEIKKISASNAEDRSGSIFYHSADLFIPGIKINFLEIVERITECAGRTLIFQEINRVLAFK